VRKCAKSLERDPNIEEVFQTLRKCSKSRESVPKDFKALESVPKMKKE